MLIGAQTKSARCKCFITDNLVCGFNRSPFTSVPSTVMQGHCKCADSHSALYDFSYISAGTTREGTMHSRLKKSTKTSWSGAQH